MQLLTVASDKGDGVSLVKKIDYVINMLRRASKLAGKNLTDRFQGVYNTPYYIFILLFYHANAVTASETKAGVLTETRISSLQSISINLITLHKNVQTHIKWKRILKSVVFSDKIALLKNVHMHKNGKCNDGN